MKDDKSRPLPWSNGLVCIICVPKQTTNINISFVTNVIGLYTIGSPNQISNEIRVFKDIAKPSPHRFHTIRY